MIGRIYRQNTFSVIDNLRYMFQRSYFYHYVSASNLDMNNKKMFVSERAISLLFLATIYSFLVVLMVNLW